MNSLISKYASLRQCSVCRSSSGRKLCPCTDSGIATPADASSDGIRSTWLTSSWISIERLNPGPFDHQRNVDRTLVRAPLILRIAGLEVAAVVADKREDRVLVQPRLHQRLADRPHRLIHLGDAAEVIGQLARPRARQRPQILRDERVRIAPGELLRRNELVAIVLVVHLQIRQRQQKRRFRRPQKTLRQPRHEIRAVDAGEMQRLSVVVE